MDEALREATESVADALRDSHNVMAADVREGRYVDVLFADSVEAIVTVDLA